MFKKTIRLENAEKIFGIKNSGVERKHHREEQILLNDLSKRGILSSSACYTSCIDLYLKQINENSEIYSTSLIEALSGKRISKSLKNQAIDKMRTFIDKQFNQKKPLLLKKMAAGGL